MAFSALLGDFIHNLRAELNHSTWVAVDEGIHHMTREVSRSRLYDQEADFTEWTNRTKS